MTSPHPNGIICRHFGECGGCAWQDVPYEEQLARLGASLEELFKGHWDRPIPVAPSPVVWHYRNKVDFNFGLRRYDEPPPPGFERETVLGFKRKGKWYWPLDMTECLIGPEGVADLLASVRAWYKERGLSAWDNRGRKGFLRTLLVRAGVRTGDRMVVLITSDEQGLDGSSFVDAVQRAWPAHAILHGVRTQVSEVTWADRLELLHGRGTIDEELRIPAGPGTRDPRFRISPFSFFQTNPLATEVLYGAIRQRIAELAPSTLYDLYGGSGGIAFACADLASEVVSVDNVESATEDGIHNAGKNGVGNVRFITQSVEKYLGAMKIGPGLARNSTVVADPSRSGLNPKALRRLVEMRPPNIVYVSCKPSVLAGELDRLTEGYELRDLRAFDLFPHTEHVEALAWLAARGG